MRGFLLTLTMLLTGTLIWAQQVSQNQYRFEFLANLPCTTVKDQAKTGTCWSFSTNSLLESESLRLGSEAVDLSEMFYVRKTYVDKARKYVRYHGTTNFSDGSLSHDVFHGLKTYGAIPESVYNGIPTGEKEHNHQELHKELKHYLDTLIAQRTIPNDWQSGFEAILDHHLGPVPDTFEFNGGMFDAMSFADSFVSPNPADYLTFTSFLHHPVYDTFVLEIPDNYAHGLYYNVALEDLFQIAKHAVMQGYTLAWDCDVSEKGFSSRQGLALVPDLPHQGSDGNSAINPFDAPGPEKDITPEMRQGEFDTYSLTDDHLMQIVGLARDQMGTEYFYIKNSWGKDVGLNGFLFASKSYFDLNTIGLVVHKEAVPSEILHKFKGS
ncbi:MAG: aminopeptidase [Saprospiraceae bacterium]|nr:aminopeptidase [Saprospiraceae bacterium]